MVKQGLPISSVVSVTPDTAVDEVTRLMEDQKIGAVVVVEENRPIGIVTDRDLVLKVLQTDRDPMATPVGEVMTGELITQEQGLGFFNALRKMSENGIRRMPIVDENDELVDIVTLDDMVRLLAKELNEVAHVAEIESNRDVRKYF